MKVSYLKSEYVNFVNDYYLQLTDGKTLSPHPHIHDFYEIIYVLSGSCIQNVNGTDILCPVGSIFIVKPMDVHFFSSQEKNTNIMSLSIKKEEFEKFLFCFSISDQQFNQVRCFISDEKDRLHNLCISALTSDDDVYLKKGLMAIIFAEIFQNLNKNVNVPIDLKRAISEMNKLENAKEGLDAFLKLSNYSRTQLWRLSLKYLNVTPTEFINNVRMKHAYNLIAYTNMSFEAISVEVGFSSFSHFIKLIKETYGTTPLKLRKKLQS